MSEKPRFLLFSPSLSYRKADSGYVFVGEDTLAQEVCLELGLTPGKLIQDHFLDGSTLFTLDENIRRKDVYAFFSARPGHDLDGEIYRFMMLIKTLKDCQAASVSAIIPCMPYARQDSSSGKRQLISARFLGKMLYHSGIRHVVTVGLHSPQIEGFHHSIDHIKTQALFADYLTKRFSNEFNGRDALSFFREEVVLVSPDAGGMKGVTSLLRQLDKEAKVETAFVQKERVGINTAQTGKVVGPVDGKICIIYDDILDTAGTLFGAARALKEAGARRVIACIDHALGNSKPGQSSFGERLAQSAVDELVVTNTRYEFLNRVKEDAHLSSKTTVLSLGPILAQTLLRNQEGSTIRELFAEFGAQGLYRVAHEAGSKTL